MHTQQAQKEPDELRARFTRWLEVLVFRARAKYLKKEANRIQTISLEDLPEDQWPVAPPYIPPRTEFDFEEERLTKAFSSLSLERQEVLTLLFLYDLKPKDAAALLHFQVKDFYNAKYQAIKKLREILKEEEAATHEP